MATQNSLSNSSDHLNSIVFNRQCINFPKGNSKKANAGRQARKLNSYCRLVSRISAVNLTTKSNLPTAISSKLKGELMDLGGLTKPMAEKMIKNSVGARNVFKIGGNNVTPQMVADIFEANGISSEAKLIKAVSGRAKKSEAKVLAERVMGKWSSKKDGNGNSVQGGIWKDGLTDAELVEFTKIMIELLVLRTQQRALSSAKTDPAKTRNELKQKKLIRV